MLVERKGVSAPIGIAISKVGSQTEYRRSPERKEDLSGIVNPIELEFTARNGHLE